MKPGGTHSKFSQHIPRILAMDRDWLVNNLPAFGTVPLFRVVAGFGEYGVGFGDDGGCELGFGGEDAFFVFRGAWAAEARGFVVNNELLM